MVIMRSYLPARWLWLMMLVPPAMEGALPMFSGWPVIDAMNAAAPYWLIVITSAVSMLMSIGVVYGFWRILSIAAVMKKAPAVSTQVRGGPILLEA
jgi:hypothetical protein